MRPWLLASLACSVILGSFAACGDDAGPAPGCGEESIQYDCAKSTVTYANTVEPLSTEYCNDCHSSEKTTARERVNAPIEYNYDTEQGWLESGAHGLIEIQCDRMPLTGGPIPAEMVKKLDEWITCKGLKDAHDHEHEQAHEHE